MKKILFAIAFVMVMVLGANAQSDGFFKSYNDSGYRTGETLETNMPPQHGMEIPYEAPLGSGILVLTALGAGYAVARRKREE